MKIDKLYTLSQFVDYCKKELHEELAELETQKDEYSAHMSAYLRIESYNEFLKQSLTREMFINEFEPIVCDVGLSELEYLEEQDRLNKIFIEYENKIIFYGADSHAYDTILLDGLHICTLNEFTFSTLEELSMHTKGRLKLKNVKI